MKSVWVHVGVLAVAAALGLSVWSKDPSEGTTVTGDRVEVWGGSPDTLQSIRFESPQRSVLLEAKKDGQGRYYVARVEKQDSPRPEPGAHGAHGADDDASGSKPPTPGKRSTQRFVAVKSADELVKQLAPLLAVRKVGPVDASRAAEFGLDKPEGTLKVTIRGVEQALVIGGSTPGGQERYARHVATGIVYAVPGDLAQSMLSAESRLLERDLHGFQPPEVTRVRITKRTKSREIVATPEKQGGWADPATPTKLDETAGNWMTKLDRLHVVEYIETPSAPLRPEDAVVRVDYFAGARSLGFLELFKLPGGQANEYLAKTEHTRWAVKVLASAAEQVDQDLASVLK